VPDYNHPRPSRATKHIHVSPHALPHSSGDIEFVGAVSDTTRLQEAEHRLRQLEMEVREILDFTPHFVAVFGRNRERLYVNRIALDYLGISLDEWRQRSVGAEVHRDDSKRLQADAERALATGSPYQLELRLCKSDGSYRWFLARYHPVRDDKGQIVRWYVVCTDIDDRKRTEERLQRENATLREEIDHVSMFEEMSEAPRRCKRFFRVFPKSRPVTLPSSSQARQEWARNSWPAAFTGGRIVRLARLSA
jgi:PAS domain S-box-containing protein